MHQRQMLQQTLSGLEAGLHVRHIATFELKCWPHRNVEAALGCDGLSDFDQIPVQEEGRVVGVIERLPSNARTKEVPGHFRALDDSILVAAEAPMIQFLRLVDESPYRLVVSRDGIEGIVTRSDILKLPVRIFLFTLITHLETVAAHLIECQNLADDEWLGYLSSDRQKHVRTRHREAALQRLNPSMLEFTTFCDKRVVLKKHLDLGERFKKDLERIEALRNTVVHVRNYVETSDRLKEFVETISLTEDWIGQLTDMALPADNRGPEETL